MAGVQPDDGPLSRKWLLRNQVPEEKERLHQEGSGLTPLTQGLPELAVVALVHKAEDAEEAADEATLKSQTRFRKITA